MSKEIAEVFPEITSLALNESVNQMLSHMPEHKQMLEIVQENLPEVLRGTSLFYKTQSQFMDNMLTVSHPTPLRNARQILAEMNKTREAIKEALLNSKKKEIELKMKQRDLKSEQDELKQELLQIEIIEIMSKIESSNGYISGAIRKLTNYTEQYKAILKKHNLENFTESQFEEEEEKYHIMKAFEQGITAARSRGGLIDEGNMIYLTQIGINGAGAQREVTEYLILENNLLKEGKEPTHKMFIMFLERMANKYKGSAKKYAEYKGMAGTVTEHALLTQGDTRLLQNKEDIDKEST